MSSSALRIIAVLLALGALVLGYMGYQASHSPAINEPPPMTEKPAPEPVRLPVLVAAQEIETGTTLSEDDVTTIFVEKQPADSYSSQQQVLDRQTRMPVAAGDLILKDHFHDFSHLVTAIRPGERAIAVRVDEVTGVGGFVQPGDFVDVFLFLDAGQEVGDDSSAQRVLSAARVLAYGNSVEQTDVEAIQQKAQLNNADNTKTETGADGQNPDANELTATEEQDEPTGKQSKTAVLAVTEKQVSELLLAESTGRLRLALLGPDALAAKVEDADKPTAAEKAEAEKQMRQVVTLEKFKPETSETGKTRPATTQRSTQPAPPPQPKVTVHRGVNAATISVDREN